VREPEPFSVPARRSASGYEGASLRGRAALTLSLVTFLGSGASADALLGEQLLCGAQELLSRANDFHQD